MILRIYTIVHTLISLVGIFSGLVVMFGMLAGKRLDGWTKWFLITTVLTSVTGFFFPFHGFTPAYAVGAISLVVLALAIFARYRRQLAGPWRWIYVVSAMIALLSKCLRRRRTGFPKDTSAARDGSDANRTAISNHATRYAGALRPAYHYLGDQISARTGCRAMSA